MQRTEDRRVCLVGAGRVGSALAPALKSKGYEIVGVASRTGGSARRLAARLGCPAGTRPEVFAARAEVVFIATPDRAIAAAAAQIRERNGFRPGQLVVHTSGATPAEVLAPAREAGADIASVHPLQSFAGTAGTHVRLAGCYFGLEGDPEGVRRARRLVADLGGKPLEIGPEFKALYHAAACVASNYLVSLMHLAIGMLARCGLSGEEALAALRPLVEGTWHNIREAGPVRALTGPVVRGDRTTLERHLAALAAHGGDFEELYRVLGVYTIGVAREQGVLDPDEAQKTIDLFRRE